jgi:hypothetical protein
MIYLIGSNPGIGLHVMYIHCIKCGYDYLSSVGVGHLIHEENIDGKFGNV